MEHIPIMEWKTKYGRIFKVRLEDKEIYFRLLNISEIEECRKDSKKFTKQINSLILNNESLSSPGAKHKLSDFIINKSFPNTEDELRERILHHRYSIKDDFLHMVIAKICSVFVSYNPDILKQKSFEQLLEILATAEMVVGKPLLYDKKGKSNRSSVVQERQENKFSKPPVDELMQESDDALAQAMAAHGKKVSRYSEVKKQNKIDKPMTDMQKQMAELNNII